MGQLELLIDTSQINSIDPRFVSVNNDGTVAFAGTDGTGTRTFVISQAGQAVAITFAGSSTRLFSGAAINNQNPPKVATRDRVSGSPPVWFIRKWPAPFGPVEVVGRSPLDYDSATSFVDINDSGVVAFTGLVNGSLDTAVLAGDAEPPIPLVAYFGVHSSIKPQISNTNRVVFRDPDDSIVVFAYPGATLAFTAADGSDGFFLTGTMPGISPDGQVVAFMV